MSVRLRYRHNNGLIDCLTETFSVQNRVSLLYAISNPNNSGNNSHRCLCAGVSGLQNYTLFQKYIIKYSVAFSGFDVCEKSRLEVL